MRIRADVRFAITPEWVLFADISDKATRLYGVLARHANAENEATVYRTTLAKEMHCSPDSVDRALKELVELQALEVHPQWTKPGQRAANDYTLRTVAPSRMDAAGGSRRDAAVVNESPSEREEPTPLSATQTSPRSPFDDWWNEWPKERRQGKGAARVAYLKAAGKTTHAVLLAGVRRFCSDPNLPVDEPSFIPLPATWLNQERWDDGPLPIRGRDPRPRDIAGEHMAEALREAELEALEGGGDGEGPAGEGLGRAARGGVDAHAGGQRRALPR